MSVLFLQKLLGKKKKHLSSSTSEGGEENDHGAPDRSGTDVIAEAEKLTTTSVDVNCVDGNGSTPLIFAALHGHRNILRALLLYSANTNAEDYLGWVGTIVGVLSGWDHKHARTCTVCAGRCRLQTLGRHLCL